MFGLGRFAQRRRDEWARRTFVRNRGGAIAECGNDAAELVHA